LSRRLMAFEASLSDHRATFRMAVHTTGPRRPVKQIGPTSCKGSLKYVTEYMKRRTKHPEDRGSKAEADQGQCGNTSRESKRTSTKNSGGRPRRSLKETRTEHEVARGLATSSALSISVAAAFRVWRSPRFRSGLDGAGCLTFQEFGVGSEAERFYHVGLHSF